MEKEKRTSEGSIDVGTKHFAVRAVFDTETLLSNHCEVFEANSVIILIVWEGIPLLGCPRTSLHDGSMAQWLQ